MEAIPESQLSTQVPSSFVTTNLEADDNLSENVSEVVSELEEDPRILQGHEKEVISSGGIYSTDNDDDNYDSSDTTEDYSEIVEQKIPTSSTSSIHGSSQRKMCIRDRILTTTVLMKFQACIGPALKIDFL